MNFLCRRPIFIVGCERSGTTLLRSMLDSHPNIAIPYEAERFSKSIDVKGPWLQVWNEENAVRIMQQLLTVPKIKFWHLAWDDVKAVWPKLAEYRYQDIIRILYSAYAKKAGKARWGDKTPVNTFDLPDLIRAFPDAQFIHMIRDGRDVYLSWKEADWASYDLVSAAKEWKRWLWVIRKHRKELSKERYLEVHYEDVIKKTEESLKKICVFLKEPFSPAMLDYFRKKNQVPQQFHDSLKLVEKPPQTDRVFRWKQSLGKDEVRTFEKIAGWDLLSFGYDIHFDIQRVINPRYGYFRIRQILKKRALL